jgi:hypothetical protein
LGLPGHLKVVVVVSKLGVSPPRWHYCLWGVWVICVIFKVRESLLGQPGCLQASSVILRLEPLSLRLQGCPRGGHVALRLVALALRWQHPGGAHIVSMLGVFSSRRACCPEVGGWLRGCGGVFKASTTSRHWGRCLLGSSVVFKVGSVTPSLEPLSLRGCCHPKVRTVAVCCLEGGIFVSKPKPWCSKQGCHCCKAQAVVFKAKMPP